MSHSRSARLPGPINYSSQNLYTSIALSSTNARPANNVGPINSTQTQLQAPSSTSKTLHSTYKPTPRYYLLVLPPKTTPGILQQLPYRLHAAASRPG